MPLPSERNLTKQTRLYQLDQELEDEYTSWRSHHRDLASYNLPDRARFEVHERNLGDRRNLKIHDSTALLASRVQSSGFQAGMTNPAKRWHRLTTQDPTFAEMEDVKIWLDDVNERLATVFIRSNFYNNTPLIYSALGVFGTGAMSLVEDTETVIHCQTYPVGSFRLANDHMGRVRVFQRKYSMTVRELVEKFGKDPRFGFNGKDIKWDNISTYVRSLFEASQMEAWVEVVHVIEPNPEWDPSRAQRDAKFKEFASTYYESSGRSGAQGNRAGNTLASLEGKFLRESGFDIYPVLAPRWQKNGEDVYGTGCPGMICLGDNKALQLMHKRKAQAIEKKVNPPMNAPGTMKNQKMTVLPGEVNFMNIRTGEQGFQPAYQIQFNTDELDEYILEHQIRIKRAFFEDLFLQLISDERNQRATATEVDRKHEEKLTMLGPVLEQINQEFLDPVIDLTFAHMEKQGLIPEPPQEIAGQPLKVEYISVMAQAQKALGIGTFERFGIEIGQLAQIKPTILDKWDEDKHIDKYAEALGMPPDITVPTPQAQQARIDRAERADREREAEIAAKQAGAVSDLAKAPTEEPNALTELIGQGQTPQ